MDNTILIDSSRVDEDGAVSVGAILYGYRVANSPDARIRLTTLEHQKDGKEIIVTRILSDSEDYDGQSGIYEAIEISAGSEIHEYLDSESNSGWLEGGRSYAVGIQSVMTLTANEILGLSGSILTVISLSKETLW